MKISKKYLLVAAVATVLSSGFMSDANASAVPNPTETTIENTIKDICSPQTFEYIKNELEDKSMSLIWHELKDVHVASVDELTVRLKEISHSLKAKLESETTSGNTANAIRDIDRFLQNPAFLFDMLVARDEMIRNLNQPTSEFIADLYDLGSPTNSTFIRTVGEMLATRENPGIPDIEFGDKCLHFSPGYSDCDEKIYCMIAMCLVASQTRFTFSDYLSTLPDARNVYRALATELAATKKVEGIERMLSPDARRALVTESERVVANIEEFNVEDFGGKLVMDHAMAGYLCTLLRNNCISRLHLSSQLSLATEEYQLLQAIAGGVKGSKSLKELELRDLEMDDARLQEWASALSKSENNFLTYLSLSGCNYFGITGVESLCEVLRDKISEGKCSITHLDLHGDYAVRDYTFDKACIEELCSVLVLPNCPIVYLDLSETGIGDDEAILLAEAFRVNNSLVEVKLGGNRIGERGRKALADALAGNELAENERKALIDVLSGKRIALREAEVLSLRGILEGKKIEEAGLKVLENVLGGEDITEERKKILSEITENKESSLKEEELQALRSVLAGKKVKGLEEEVLQTLHDIVRDKKIEEAGQRALEDILDDNDITKEGEMALKKALGNTSLTSISLGYQYISIGN